MGFRGFFRLGSAFVGSFPYRPPLLSHRRPFSSRQRWKHFVALLVMSGVMFVFANAVLPLVLVRPTKFCFFFTMGSMLSMASFAVLRGPVEQCKHMCSPQR